MLNHVREVHESYLEFTDELARTGFVTVDLGTPLGKESVLLFLARPENLMAHYFIHSYEPDITCDETPYGVVGKNVLAHPTQLLLIPYEDSFADAQVLLETDGQDTGLALLNDGLLTISSAPLLFLHPTTDVNIHGGLKPVEIFRYRLIHALYEAARIHRVPLIDILNNVLTSQDYWNTVFYSPNTPETEAYPKFGKRACKSVTPFILEVQQYDYDFTHTVPPQLSQVTLLNQVSYYLERYNLLDAQSDLTAPFELWAAQVENNIVERIVQSFRDVPHRVPDDPLSWLEQVKVESNLPPYWLDVICTFGQLVTDQLPVFRANQFLFNNYLNLVLAKATHRVRQEDPNRLLNWRDHPEQIVPYIAELMQVRYGITTVNNFTDLWRDEKQEHGATILTDLLPLNNLAAMLQVYRKYMKRVDLSWPHIFQAAFCLLDPEYEVLHSVFLNPEIKQLTREQQLHYLFAYIESIMSAKDFEELPSTFNNLSTLSIHLGLVPHVSFLGYYSNQKTQIREYLCHLWGQTLKSEDMLALINSAWKSYCSK